jgi:putative membrane-bound dehydrogenase-like protein
MYPLTRTVRTVHALAIALLCAAGTSALGVDQEAGRAHGGPLSPEAALGAFELEPGYRIELAASEPLIRDPVAIAFDERGRLYVAENRGYPDPLERPAQPPREGVIALLEDSDSDGRFDRRTEFASGLTYPNGIMPWNGGVFVTCAPDLIFLRDTTGDGIADERRVVLTGFDTTKTAQIRFSHPTLGLDNWVYLTGGLNGGRVTAPDRPEQPAVEFTNSDSRFNPITQAFELTGGQGQYGLTFDDHGRRFVCSNRHPLRHVVLEPRDLQRNPHLAWSETMQDVSTVGAQAAVWPISGDMTTASFMPTLLSAPHAGTFTAASGVHIHRGTALPEGHQGSIFICESAQNLVQRQIRSASGVTFAARPARTGRDFLASRDNWFRPVFAANGPDGALYIVDMYRKVIDHPQYVPEGSRALLDFQAGKERGRIYRLGAQDWKAERKPVDLGRLAADELSRTLEHPNAWWRETAQRLLVERRDGSAIPHVRKVAAGGRTDVGRIHGLWTLEGLGGVEPGDVAAALRDRAAAVRENALRLAGPRLAASPDLLEDVLRLADDPDARVRFQAALALGATPDARAVRALASIAHRDGAGAWVRAAVLSSVAGRTNDFLRAFTVLPPPARDVHAAVMQDLGELFGAAESPELCLDLIEHISAPTADFGWQPAALAGIARGMRARRPREDGRSPLMALLASEASQSRKASDHAATVLSRSAAAALDVTLPVDLRLSAIGLLGHTDRPSAGETLERLLEPRQASEIQVAAARALLQLPEPTAARVLVEAGRWEALTPQVREAALSAMMAEERHMVVLLDALESNAIAAAALSPSRRGRLMNHRNPAIQARARAQLAAFDSGDRMQVYRRLSATVLTHGGSPAPGKAVFERRCAACHRFDGAGGRVGPDLGGLRNQPVEAILLHVIVPDYEISPGYEAYVLTTRDGRTLVGRLESEAPNSLTITDAASQQHVTLRSHVLSIAASTGSLMPNELERGLSDQDLRDLIAYLKAGVYVPGSGR